MVSLPAQVIYGLMESQFQFSFVALATEVFGTN